jgi:hypothetical protein
MLLDPIDISVGSPPGVQKWVSSAIPHPLKQFPHIGGVTPFDPVLEIIYRG